MFCKYCGEKNPDGSDFCQSCGAYLGPANGENRQAYGQSVPGQETGTDHVPAAPGQETDTDYAYYEGREPEYPEGDYGRYRDFRSPREEKRKTGGDTGIRVLIGLIALLAVTATAFAVCRVITGKYPLELLAARDSEEEAAQQNTVVQVITPAGQANAPGLGSLYAKQEKAPAQENIPAEESIPAQENIPAEESIPAQESVSGQNGTVSYTQLAGNVNGPSQMSVQAASDTATAEAAAEAETAGAMAEAAAVEAIAEAEAAGAAEAAAAEAAAEAETAGAMAEAAAVEAIAEAEAAGAAEVNVEAMEAENRQAPVEMRLISVTEVNMNGRTAAGISSAAASSTIIQSGTSNDPVMVFDMQDETSWQEGVAGYGIGEWLKASFDGNYKVKYMAFRLGNWKNDKYYYGNAKPKTLEILIGNFRGEITFPDERAVQWVEFTQEVDANALEITIRDVYPGTSWQDTCIAAVDVYGERIG